MKAMITMLVAASFMLAMSVAQAGVPAVAPATNTAAHPAAVDPIQLSNDSGVTTPTIPGAQVAQNSAMSNGQQLAVIGGVLLAVVLVAIAASGGGDSAPSGGTGTTGTH